MDWIEVMKDKVTAAIEAQTTHAGRQHVSGWTRDRETAKTQMSSDRKFRPLCIVELKASTICEGGVAAKREAEATCIMPKHAEVYAEAPRD